MRIVSGGSNRAIASQFEIGRSAVGRHRKHIAPAVAEAIKAKEAAEGKTGENLLAEIRQLQGEAARLGKLAEAGKDYRTALTSVRERVRILELISNAQLEDRLSALEEKLLEGRETA